MNNCKPTLPHRICVVSKTQSMSDGGKCYRGECSRQGGAVLEWGVIGNFKFGGEAALIREVTFDLRPTGGEEVHVQIPGGGAFQAEGTSGARSLRPQHAC